MANIGRGLLMGGADIIPGVSGGTVALILGIYARLVRAISRVDVAFLGMLRRREWSAAADHLDLRFLAMLGLGILCGVASLANLMHFLLEHQQSYTFAGFFGLILASGVLVARLARPRTRAEAWFRLALAAAAAAFAFWLVGLDAGEARTGNGYVFLCGAVAICAMILPGISGAYILILLGKYRAITDILHRVTALDAGAADFGVLAVFASGCVLGLVAFSKVLRWLLTICYGPTLAALCGFMLGSLRTFQIDKTPDAVFRDKVFRLLSPHAWNSEVIACLLIAIAAAAVVFAMDRIARRGSIPIPPQSRELPKREP